MRLCRHSLTAGQSFGLLLLRLVVGTALPLVYLALMIGLFTIGPGRYSLDALLWGRTEDVDVVAHEPLHRSSAA